MPRKYYKQTKWNYIKEKVCLVWNFIYIKCYSVSWDSYSSFSIFSSCGADSEMLEDGVGVFIEFSLVDCTWVLGVNLYSFGLSPFPVFIGWLVFKSTGKVLKSDLDFTVREGTTIVGIEFFECSIWLFLDNTLWSLSSRSDTNGRGGSDKCGDGKFHFVL